MASVQDHSGLRKPFAGAQVETPEQRASLVSWLLAASALVVFLALSVGYCMTRSPWWDEGIFADVAINFRNTGHLGSIVLAPHGYLNWPGVHQFTYWQLPLYLITEGLWLRVMPESVQSARLLSVVWGCAYLLGWFLFVRGLTRNANLALFVTAVVATDYSLLSAASDARMDMMCAAQGELGIAVYVTLRESRPRLAIVFAGLFGAASLFCHPMGIVTNLTILGVILFLDWRRIRWSAVPFTALFYVLGIALCMRYALENPVVYHAQSSAAASYRVADPGTLLHNIGLDLRNRYFGYYFELLHGVNKLKAFSLLFGLAGVFGIALTNRLRAELLGRTLLLLAIITYVGVAALDNQDFPIYFIYSVPIFTACGAFWVYRLWPHGGFARVVACGLLASGVAASLGGFAVKIREQGLSRQFQSAINVIQKNLPPGGTVYGGAELGFALGFGPHLVDDRYLGYWSGNPLPAIYAMDPIYVPMSTEMAAWNASRQTLMQHYRLIFSDRDYRIYLRNDLPVRQ